jgi:S-adenosylmethionine:tRNA ribosyltransferase-isomerase
VETAAFHYDLPVELIAQQPGADRGGSRLMVLCRERKSIKHKQFRDLLEFLHPGDLLVLNNSRVIPARLFGRKSGSGGEVECLLYREVETNDWWSLARPAKRLRPGSEVKLRNRHGSATSIRAVLVEKNEEGHCRFRFEGTADIRNDLETIGELPLPPYIRRDEGASSNDFERYQTVYSKTPGSVAAPTAGLHFTPELLKAIQARDIATAEVTLHVGLGTFAPVKSARVEEHAMHSETFEISPETAAAVNLAKARGGKVVAVGTTSTRALESAGEKGLPLNPQRGSTKKFIYPPYDFKVVDALVTNFHLPESTLLMLASAFAAPGQTSGREWMLQAYQEAVRQKYRFFSYGDAMLIY